jgi:hypothetical protein
MYPEIFYSNTFTLLAEAEVGKHFYWNIAGFLSTWTSFSSYLVCIINFISIFIT